GRGHDRGRPDAELGPRPPGAPGLRTQCAVEGDALGRHVAPRVLKVDRDRPMTDALAADTGVFQPLAELAILAAVAHALVETIDRQHVPGPAGRVVTVPARARGADRVEQARGSRAGSELAV